jgi:hypothetical protein
MTLGVLHSGKGKRQPTGIFSVEHHRSRYHEPQGFEAFCPSATLFEEPMSQTLTIQIDGREGRVLPDSVGTVLSAVFKLLRAMDTRGWPVGTPRVEWRVSEAKLVNPLTVTAAADILVPTVQLPDLALGLISQLQDIASGVRPQSLPLEDYKYLKKLGVEARRSRSLIITGKDHDRVAVFHVPRAFSRQIAHVLRQPRQVSKEYSSLDGTLIRLANDPLKDDGSAILRDRFSGAEVRCHAAPGTASKMAPYVDRKTRVVLYGTVTYEDGVPQRIDVEDFITVPSDDVLPTLDDLRAMRLRPSGGRTVEEFLDDLRGDD